MSVAFGANFARPDGEVKRKGKSFKGADVINTSGVGQSAGAKVKQGGKAIFIVRYRNTTLTDTADDFIVGGCAPPAEFDVSYKALGEDVTAEVNDGPYVFENVKPDKYTPKLKAKVKVEPSASDGYAKGVCVPARDALSGTQGDEPEWKIDRQYGTEPAAELRVRLQPARPPRRDRRRA